jgi:hypothetical protein
MNTLWGLSVFLKKDLIKIRPNGNLIKIRPINNTSVWRRGAAHLINASIKKDANKYFTQTYPNLFKPQPLSASRTAGTLASCPRQLRRPGGGTRHLEGAAGALGAAQDGRAADGFAAHVAGEGAVEQRDAAGVGPRGCGHCVFTTSFFPARKLKVHK